MTGPVGAIVAAHAFLTRLPVPRSAHTGMDPRRVMVWLPLVGLTVGLIAAAVRWAADPLGPVFATLAACAVAPLVTGAFHEDGLADTFDGLGPFDRARRLAAMRDSRLGTFGVLALVFSVAARVALLAPLGWRQAGALLVAGHVLGRWSTLPLARWAPPARGEGLGSTLTGLPVRTVLGGTLVAAAIAGPALWWASPGAAGVAPAAAALVTLFTGVWWTRAFGGVTGDTYGATNQLAEIATIAGATAML